MSTPTVEIFSRSLKEQITMSCLNPRESLRSTKAITVGKKWLIKAMETTATTTSSSDNQPTTATSQDKVDNSTASTNTKVSHLVSGPVKKITPNSTSSIVEIDSNIKKGHKINKNAGNLMTAPNPIPNIARIPK